MESQKGTVITAILQTRVDAKRNIWLCARDRFNSGNPVYVSNVPVSSKAGDLIHAVIADDRGTLFYVEEEETHVESNDSH